MEALKKFITFAIFPLTFFGGIGLGIWGLKQGFPKEIILGTTSIGGGLIIIICEQLNPFFRNWNKSQQDVKTDLVHLGISMMLVPTLLQALLSVTMLILSLKITEALGYSLWPSGWPLGLQLILAMLIGGFFEYWVHRSMHEVPFLWRYHATHHSPGRLYWLNAARFHPLDTFASFFMANAPLILLGANGDVLLLTAIWVSLHGMFQHCNIHLRLGPLNWVFSMAELHRWHHSLKLEEANTNYGNNIIFWDVVFGTYFFPKDREPSEKIGLSEIDNFPKGYIGQLLSPFRWKKITGKK